MENKIININFFYVCSNIIPILPIIGLNLFFTYSYIIDINNVINIHIKNLFLATIIFIWIGMISYLTILIYIVKYYDKYISSKVIDYLQITKRKFVIILEFLCFVGIYFTSLFLMYCLINNYSICNMSQYNGLMCLSIQICVYIWIIVTCISIINMVYVGIYLLINKYKNFIDDNTSANDINKLNKMKLLLANNFISYRRPKITKECILCHKKVSHDLNANWSVLICGHKYHTECISNFARLNTFCPICVPQLIVNTNDIV